MLVLRFRPCGLTLPARAARYACIHRCSTEDTT